MLVHHPKVHEQMRRQHVQLQVSTLDVERRGITHQLEHGICQCTAAKQLRLVKQRGHAGRRFRQWHEAGTRSLVQRFYQRLHLVLEHAGHQPFAAFLVHLIERKQGHIDRHAILGITGLMQVIRAAIHPAQPQCFGERLGGDARSFMPHQLFLAQHQQPRLLFDLVLVPALAARAAANIGR